MKMTVPASEHGVIRLFAIDLEPAEVPSFQDPVYDGPDDVVWPLKTALGAKFLDQDFVEVFDVADLGELGLRGYLTQGVGIAQTEVDAHHVALAAAKGHLFLVTSAAFGGFESALTIQPPLRHIATLNEVREPVKFEALPDGGAKGAIATDAKPPKSDARIGGMIATYALIAMFALVGLMIWVSG